jgi:cyclopropane fatty-acyl-phospholipid synthase-like methyltransferase
MEVNRNSRTVKLSGVEVDLLYKWLMDEQLKDELRQAYNSRAAEREAKEIPEWRIGQRAGFADMLLREGKQTLLELGAGTGVDSRYFHDHGIDVLCTDLSPENVRYCQSKGLNARVMDYTQFNLPRASYDAVYAMNSLLHLPKGNLPGVLKSIRTVLKDDGLFFMGVHGGIDSEGVWELDHYEPKRFFAFYTDNQLKEILSGVFEIEAFVVTEVEGENDDLHHQSFILRKRPDNPSYEAAD